MENKTEKQINDYLDDAYDRAKDDKMTEGENNDND
jgi:hypothetical protein